MGELDGKVAIVTGAARGMGAAHVARFVEAGARVVATDVLATDVRGGDGLDDDELEVVTAFGDEVVFVQHDVASEAQWSEVVDTAVTRFGGLDIVVNNAGVHWTRAIEDETVDGMRRAFEVNVVGPFLGIRSAIVPMRARGGGSIVNICSLAGTTGLGWHAAYGASKWGARGLSRTAAAELGADNIRVNAVMPGPIETSMLPADREGLGAARFARLPLGRSGRTDEVAELVVFLASDRASYITGGEFAIDGGSSAGPALTARPAAS